MKIDFNSDKGFTIVSIHEAVEVKDFYSVADVLGEKFDAEFEGQIDDFDSVYLDLKIEGINFTLCYSNFFGTELYCQSGKSFKKEEDDKLLNVAEKLKEINLHGT